MTRRFRSILDNESFDDLAPVRSYCGPSPGAKSRLGSSERGGVEVEDSLRGSAAGSEGGGVSWLDPAVFGVPGGGGGREANVLTE